MRIMPCLNDGGDVQLVSGDPVSDAGGLVVYRPGIENSDTECRWDGRSSHSMPNCLAAFAMAFFSRCYAVQGHSRSPILVPIESPCTTFH